MACRELVHKKDYTDWCTITGETWGSVEVSLKVDISHMDREKPRIIKVHRRVGDPNDKNINAFNLKTYTLYQNCNINYQNRAYADINFNALETKGNTPSRVYEVDGLIIQVPSNYNPRSHTYHGTWDGTFKNEWTNNPAWVLYDLLTNKRYGLGREIKPEQINKLALYEVGKYCDELVDDGFGGQEHRFTFNGVINSQARAYEVLQMVTSAFNGMLYVGGGSIFAIPDRLQKPIKIFGRANVINGVFSYESTSAKLRHTSIRVTWINPKNNYEPEIECFDDPEAIALYGLNTLDITAHGCTSRGQAQRMARYALFTEKYETDKVDFTVGMRDNDIRPGDYILVADEMIQDGRLFGQLKAIDKAAITTDFPVTLSEGWDAPKVVMTNKKGVTKTYPIKKQNATTDYIQFEPQITTNQAKEFTAGDVWTIYDQNNINPRKFRVLSVKENKDLTFSVTALSHFDDKFKYVEQGIEFEAQPPMSLNPTGVIAPVAKCQFKPFMTKFTDDLKTVGLTITWSASSDSRVTATEMIIYYPDGKESETKTYGNYQVTLDKVYFGDFGVGLRYIGNKGEIASEWRYFNTTIASPYKVPPKPEKLALESFNGGFNAKWMKPNYAYSLTYEYYTQSYESTTEAMQTPSTVVGFNTPFKSYPQTVSFYVRSVGPTGLTSEFVTADCTVDIWSDEDDPLKFLESIDRTWLTDDLQQEIGMFDTLNSIGETILKQTARIDRVWTATQTALAFAVEGINAEIKDNKEATAEKFSQIGALYGEQMKCDKPNPVDCAADFGLKWYDGSDPKYPQATNPVYNKDLPKSVTNFPYLPVMPSTSLIGQTQAVRAADNAALAESFRTIGANVSNNELDNPKATFTEEIKATSGVIGAGIKSLRTWAAETDKKAIKIQEDVDSNIDSAGNTIAGYAVKIKETSADGKTVKAFGGFGLTKDGVGTTFGINADTFFIAKPGQSAVSTTKDSDTYIMAVTQQNTYIGTRDTWFKGNMQSSNFVKGTSGWQINSNGKSIFSEVEIYSTSADSNNPTKLTLKNGTIIQSFTQAQKKSPE